MGKYNLDNFDYNTKIISTTAQDNLNFHKTIFPNNNSQNQSNLNTPPVNLLPPNISKVKLK